MFCLKGGQIARSIRKQVKMYKKELKTRSPWVTTTTRQQKKVFLLLTSNSSSLFIIHSFASHFFRIKKKQHKKGLLNDDWRANEALKKKKVQHNIIEKEKPVHMHKRVALITLFLLWLLLLLLPCSWRCKERMKNRALCTMQKELISVSSYIANLCSGMW